MDCYCECPEDCPFRDGELCQQFDRECWPFAMEMSVCAGTREK